MTAAVAVAVVAVAALHVPSCGILPVYFETIPENKKTNVSFVTSLMDKLMGKPQMKQYR